MVNPKRDHWNNIRTQIFEFVNSIALGGTIDQIGRSTGYLDGYSEMMCIWFDDYDWDHPESYVRNNFFHEKEIKTLNEFSSSLEDFTPPKDKNRELTEDMNLFKDTDEWLQVVKAAKEAIEEWQKLDTWDITPLPKD